MIFRCSFSKCLQQTNGGFFFSKVDQSHIIQRFVAVVYSFRKVCLVFVWFQFEFSVHKILSQESMYSFSAYRMYTVRTGEELSVKSVFFVPIL